MTTLLKFAKWLVLGIGLIDIVVFAFLWREEPFAFPLFQLALTNLALGVALWKLESK